jgi:exopolysaccharide biosynthesis polyprenyl glycosylphosphotransferase
MTTPRTTPKTGRTRRLSVLDGGRTAARWHSGHQGREAFDLTPMLRRDSRVRRALMVSDALAIATAITLATIVAGGDSLRPPALLFVPLLIGLAKVIGLYDRDDMLLRKTTLEEAPRVFHLATIGTVIAVVLQRPMFDGPFGGDQVLGILALLFVLPLGARALTRLLLLRTTSPERCIVIGDPSETAPVARRLAGDQSVLAVLVAELPLDFEQDRTSEHRQLTEMIYEHRPDRVIMAPRTADSEAVLDAVRLVKRIGVKVALRPRLFDVVGSAVQFDSVQGLTLLSVPPFGLSRSSLAVKRSMDVIGAGIGLIAVLPLFALIAVLIKLDGTGGPVLFRQARVGRDGHVFSMLKFRTMVPDADSLKNDLRSRNELEGVFKIADDPRVTRIGRLLRKSSLDELPQLLNILRGDMSLVGPRPLIADEDRQVQGWNRRRLALTPGMTGPWQVLGGTKVPLQEMVKIDYLYIGNWSLWTDIRILVRTLLHVARRSNT